MKKPARRTYHSEQRQKQAEGTRGKVVAAARQLFFRSGFQTTTIEAIAAQAGVSVPTVYGVFGSKRALMLAISDDMDVRAGFAKVEADIRASRDPLEQLRLITRAQVDFFERNADVLEPLREAGRVDEELAVLWNEGHARHQAGYARLVRKWAAAGVLRQGLDEKEAADAMSAVTWVDVYRYFIDRCGWTPDQYREWLFSTLSILVLEPAE